MLHARLTQLLLVRIIMKRRMKIQRGTRRPEQRRVEPSDDAADESRDGSRCTALSVPLSGEQDDNDHNVDAMA